MVADVVHFHSYVADQRLIHGLREMAYNTMLAWDGHTGAGPSNRFSRRNLIDAWLNHVGDKGHYLADISGGSDSGVPRNLRQLKSAVTHFLGNHGFGALQGGQGADPSPRK